MRNFCVVLCFLFTATVVIGWAEEPPISLRVEPQTSYIVRDERVYRRIIIRIPHHEDNRNLRLEWDSAGEAGATERQLLGSNSPYIIEGGFFFGRASGLTLPAGRYLIRATLTRSGKKFSTTVETNIILAGEGL